MRRAPGLLILAAVVGSFAACGKKGPPLAPLRPVPEAPSNVTAARLGPDVHLRFTVPAQNIGLPGPVELERIEIYAASVAAGAPAPPNREFLTAKYLVGTLDVRPAVGEGEPAPSDPAETRPAPGEQATFVEPLTTEMLNPPVPQVVVTPPAQDPADPAAKPAAPAVQAPAYATRIYAVRGVTSRGRPGNPSPRITVPLIDLPAPPSELTADFTASEFILTWTPPLAEVGGPAVQFNVYRAEAPAVPLAAAPVATPRAEIPGVEFGAERCFWVRSVVEVGGIPVESEASRPACVTPRDIFPPAPPAGLNGVATAGAISLIWDPGPEADLAGYLVLRAEAPGDTLQPITPDPIREPSYRDATVAPGVRYVYAVIAVDGASPPNRSAPSARIEVTAAQ